MDLFQPVTLLVDDGVSLQAIAFANLRLAVLSAMKEIAPSDRERTRIRSKDGEIAFPDIALMFDSLRPTTGIAAAHA